MKVPVKTLLAAALAAALPAMAQPMPAYTPWYLGVGAGQGHIGTSGTDLTGFENAQVDNNETTYTVRGGFRFSPYAAIEIGYYDLGKYKFHGTTTGGLVGVDGEAKAKSYGISLVGILPIDRFDLYGRIGYARSEIKVNASAPLAPTPVNEKDHQNEATYGIGARWTFVPQWALFGEWMKNDKINVDSYLIGVDFRF
jgi:OOP family OmpA-OmpF porin